MKEKRFPMGKYDILMRTQLHDRYMAIDKDYAIETAANGLPYMNPTLSRKYRMFASIVSIKKKGDDKEFGGSIPDVEAWAKDNMFEDEWNLLSTIYQWLIEPGKYAEILKTLEPEENRPNTKTP
jgi:hypothetical protein